MTDFDDIPDLDDFSEELKSRKEFGKTTNNPKSTTSSLAEDYTQPRPEKIENVIVPDKPSAPLPVSPKVSESPKEVIKPSQPTSQES